MINTRQIDSLPTARYASSGILAMLAALLFTTAIPVLALTLAEFAKISDGNGFEFNAFGVSVGISGDWAVIGGRPAFVFERNAVGTWTQAQKLLAADEFARSVSISGNRTVAGLPFNDDNGLLTGLALSWPWSFLFFLPP